MNEILGELGLEEIYRVGPGDDMSRVAASCSESGWNEYTLPVEQKRLFDLNPYLAPEPNRTLSAFEYVKTFDLSPGYNDQSCSIEEVSSRRTVLSELPQSYQDDLFHGDSERSDQAGFLITLAASMELGGHFHESLRNYFSVGEVKNITDQLERYLEEQIRLAKIGQSRPRAEISLKIKNDLNKLNVILNHRANSLYQEYKTAVNTQYSKIGRLNARMRSPRAALPRLGRTVIQMPETFKWIKRIDHLGIKGTFLFFDIAPRLVKILEAEDWEKEAKVQTVGLSGAMVGGAAGYALGRLVCGLILAPTTGPIGPFMCIVGTTVAGSIFSNEADTWTQDVFRQLQKN